MLTDEIKLEVAHHLFSAAYAHEYENAGGRFAPGTEICGATPRQPDEVMLPIIEKYIDELGDAWGYPADVMLSDLMEISQDELERALSHTLMGCWGHGIGLGDDHGEFVAIAEARLGREIDESPFHGDFHDLDHRAMAAIQDELRGDEDDDGLDDYEWASGVPLRPGDQCVVEARMPTGETLRCRANILRILDGRLVVRVDEGYDVEPDYYAMMCVVVDLDEVAENFLAPR